MTADTDLLGRITVRADVFGGKPIIRDLRIAVEHVLGMLAAGDNDIADICQSPHLQRSNHEIVLRHSMHRHDVHRLCYLSFLSFSGRKSSISVSLNVISSDFFSAS